MAFVKDPLNATTPREIIEYSQDLEDRVEGGFDDVDDITTSLSGDVNALNNFKNDVADYIVDFDETSNGRWEKWNSGKLVQVKIMSLNFPPGTLWNGLYYYDFSIGDWLIPFSRVFYAKENVKNNTYWSNLASFSNSSTGTIRVFRPTDGGADNVTVSIYGVGTWK